MVVLMLGIELELETGVDAGGVEPLIEDAINHLRLSLH